MPYLLLALLTLASGSCRLAGPDNASVTGDTLVVRSGTSFGECLGYCRTELTLSGGMATLIQRGTSSDRFPDRMVERPIADSVAARIEATLDVHTFRLLDARYGCPDCNDGGVEWIEIDEGGDVHRVTFEFGHAPEALEPLADALRAYRSALTSIFDEP